LIAYKDLQSNKEINRGRIWSDSKLSLDRQNSFVVVCIQASTFLKGAFVHK
jgi:hypothetical protein